MRKDIQALILSGTLMSMAALAAPLIHHGSLLKNTQIPQMQPLWLKGSLICTATLIGPKTIITAAHCTDATSFGSSNLKSIKVRFIRHPKYKREINLKKGLESPYDLAVGILEKNLISISPISVTPNVPSVGGFILFAGAGEPKISVRQYGFVEVIKITPTGVTARAIKKKMQIAGSGDSGGPTFFRNEDGSIEVFAVNSTSTQKINYSLRYGEYGKAYTMGSALVFPKEAAGRESFLNQVAKQKNLDICGLNMNCPPVIFK